MKHAALDWERHDGRVVIRPEVVRASIGKAILFFARCERYIAANKRISGARDNGPIDRST